MPQQPQKQKKQPERKCAGCNERKPKKALVRIVRTPDGSVRCDTTGKIAGRGVYLCPNKTCLAAARKAKRLERSLETPVPDSVYEELEALFAALPEVSPDDA